MEKFLDFPPYSLLKKVLEHCPKAGALYLKLWEERDLNYCIKIIKKDVRDKYLTSLCKFRHDVFLLNKEAVLTVSETPTQMKIQLVATTDEINADGLPLC